MGKAIPWAWACKEWISNYLALCFSNCLSGWRGHLPKNAGNMIQNISVKFAEGVSLHVTLHVEHQFKS